MDNRWSESDAARAVAQWGEEHGEMLAQRTYSSRLLGANPALVLHGGGNTSVKGSLKDLTGDTLEVIFVKGSGVDLATITPMGHVALDLARLQKWRKLESMDDVAMNNTLRIARLDAEAPTPSIEALLHAFLPHTFIDHCHADAILALSNRPNGEAILREALGDDVILTPYVKPGFALARAAAEAHDANPGKRGMVLMGHGLVTWGETAQTSHEATLTLVERAESWLRHENKIAPIQPVATTPGEARARFREMAPRLRGFLSPAMNAGDRTHRPMILNLASAPDILALLEASGAHPLLDSPPLTADHLIRTKPWPMWLNDLESAPAALTAYAQRYQDYVERHASTLPPGLAPFDPLPRVVLLPGVGAVCVGKDPREAAIARDITVQTLRVKANLLASGATYQGLGESHLWDMEYLPQQHAKLDRGDPPLRGMIALVTGAAGAIGSGVTRALLNQGACVAVSDLPGEALDTLVAELAEQHPGRVLSVAMDVSSPDGVAAGFAATVEAWGGLDLLVINAGLAHVSKLMDLQLEDFRRLERVNVEGTLLLLAQAGRLFKAQGIGGDIVLISTKNVFAPGAGFGAYSATKAGSHQLARIAVVEMAEMGVRVNMVAPDAVFSDGARKSGLWAAVGPDRMKARGLDEAGLEEYYRNRNLLKARVTADHVGQAVLYFAQRRSPTTGATLPVDGGLPDATPR